MYPNMSLLDGLFFGGGIPAQNRLGIGAYGLSVVMLAVFIPSYLIPWLKSKAMKGIIVRETGN